MNININIYTSEQLKGLKGDNGETFCVFAKARNPLASGWKWFFTMDEAEKFREELVSGSTEE